jgi:hypothetical protein
MSNSVMPVQFGAKTYVFNTQGLSSEQLTQFSLLTNQLGNYSTLSVNLDGSSSTGKKSDILLLHTTEDRTGETVHQQITQSLGLASVELEDLNAKEPSRIKRAMTWVRKKLGLPKRGPGELEVPMELITQLVSRGEQRKSEAQYLADVKAALISRAMLPPDQPEETLSGFYKYYRNAVRGWEESAKRIYKLAFPQSNA